MSQKSSCLRLRRYVRDTKSPAFSAEASNRRSKYPYPNRNYWHDRRSLSIVKTIMTLPSRYSDDKVYGDDRDHPWARQQEGIFGGGELWTKTLQRHFFARYGFE